MVKKLTRKQERAERQRRRQLKKSDIEARRQERQVRREKREKAKAYAEEAVRKNGQIGRLHNPPYCEICCERRWCVHQIGRRINPELREG